MRKVLHVLALIVTALAFAACAAPPSGTLRGTVVDGNGAAIGNAYITVHEDAAGKSERSGEGDLTSRTDQTGQFQIQVESDSFYDVCVLSDGFTPECYKVFVDGETI